MPLHTNGGSGTDSESGATRRQLLAGIGGLATASVSALAGCTGGQGENQVAEEVYVVAFHWGFRMIRPDGSVAETLEVSQGDRLKIHGVNLEPIAEGEDLDVPDDVYSAAEDGYEDWEHASVERIAPKLNMAVEELEEKLETAEEEYKDHGMALTNPDGGQAFNAMLAGDMEQPVEETVTLDSSGSYGFICTTYCGEGHSYMQLQEAIQVS